MTQISFEEALEALKRPLEFVARDAFANLDRVSDMGQSLRSAAQNLARWVPSQKSLTAWARDAARWDVLPRPERERLVAQGLRLCATAKIAGRVPVPARTVRPPVSASLKSDGGEGLATVLLGMPGVGPITFERLRGRGLETVGDLVAFLPKRWDDLRDVISVGRLTVGEAQLTRATVERTRVIPAFRRRILEVHFRGEDGQPLRARWFYFRGNMAARFQPGSLFLLAGTPRSYKDGLEMIHPETREAAEEAAGEGSIRVRYPEIEGVGGRLVEKLCRAVCERFIRHVEDGIPAGIVERHSLPSQAEALTQLHLPPSSLHASALTALNSGTSPAQRRLIFDEFFFLQLGLAKRRGLQRREPGIALPAAASDRRSSALERVWKCLPFAPTGAQVRAVDEIANDLAQPHPMHRLLQGDVGSGKTAVALAASEIACASGYQAAFMAPTEILAEQHARTLEPWLKKLGRSLTLLTASTPRAARESALALLAAGRLDVVVGTHALLAERVSFDRLGLVVIDEQHRFGVAQRALLREKGGVGDLRPHLLVMTATPIPRTLALTVYGDLDATILDELPPGREPPQTKLLSGKRARDKALAGLRAALEEKRQAYWVCPLIEESEKIDFADVTEAAAWLRSELDVEVGLVHGRLPTAERDDVMNRFRSGKLPVLVATTVIEVGVDVPNASMMVIEGADRFGLAQLHQLRGRIGRGGGRSSCLLLAGSKAGDAGDRLAVMEESTDGFVIAEADLRIRGPGEIFGTRQAGLPRLRYADLVRDVDVLRLARAEAFGLLERDPQLADPAHETTRRVLMSRWDQAKLFGEEAG